MTAILSPPGEVGTAGAAASIRSRWDWRNWPVVVKLAAVLLVPTIVALVAGILRIVDQAGAAPGYARISQIVHLQQQLSDVIGSLARERDLATAFVATGRIGDHRDLDAQFRTVDGGLRVIGDAAGQVEGLDFARSPLSGLGALAPLRASVTTGFGPVEVVVTEYSDAIDPLIELDAALTRQLDDVAVTNDAAAVHDLLAGREQVARQHAIVLAALYTNRLGPGQIEDLRTAQVRLTTDQDAVRATLGPAERADAIAGIGPDTELSRQRLLQFVINRGVAGQPLNTAPEEWDRRSAVVVDNFAAVEKKLRQRIDQTAQQLLDRVRSAAGLNSVILFSALGLGVVVGILVTRALLSPLSVLKRTALDVADRRLPEAMARIRDGDAAEAVIDPVPVATHEEIGQVARAFDEVHSQAVRLATEQAELRANVNDIFVNLSRRTQGLVERQLKLIDRLESSEQDPQQLDNLFQLDHLATRMRRNSENLLVLAGNEATSRSGRPVRLIDVLRAAVSEVDQYQRLVLQQPPAVLILGRTANDLVHLLAELLDNATQFSPPESHVMVSSDLATDGAVTIEVADRGVGMSDDELAEANHRLASDVVVDASVSRRMGLFVVGRLAGRHGIEVQLRRGEAGVGIWATVVMPPRLVRLTAEPVESPAAVAPDMAALNGSAQGAAPGAVAAALESGPPGPPGVPAPRPQADPKTAADDEEFPVEESAAEQAGAGNSEQGSADQNDDERVADQPSGRDGQAKPSGNAVSPPHTENRSTPVQPPPAPPAPPVSPVVDEPVQLPGGGAGTDLFRPARVGPAEPVEPMPPPGPGPRVTLRHSTPIFDDVATAWFKEHEAVPVRWTAPSPDAPLPDAPPADVPPADAAPSEPPPADTAPAGTAPAATATAAPTPAAGTPAETAPAGTAAAAGIPPADTAAASTAASPVVTPATASRPPLTRRQPGKTLAGAQPGNTAKPTPSGPPAPAPSQPAGRPTSDWGAGDEGWRAAQALARPVTADMTPMGLPRRQPRALLVPGAAGAVQPTTVPARSAELIRGRLASYQRGVRQGREASANGDQVVNDSQPAREPKPQDGEENTL